MKKYIFLCVAAVAAIFTACSTDEQATAYPDKLEVVVTPGWDVTRGMTSSSQTVRVAVELNVQSVHWMVSSDSDWCVVDEEENHVGSGEFTVEVTANEDFDLRKAVVTITAGAFVQRMSVDQSGNIFILDRIYSVVAANDTGTFDVQVKTRSAWQPVDSEWIHGEVIETSDPDENGMTTSTLRIGCDANTAGGGRYGTLAIEPTDGFGYGTVYTIYQFGSDVRFDEENRIELAARGEETFRIAAPAETIIDVACPAWVTYTAESTEEGQANYTFSVTENPSDTRSDRVGVIELSIKDIAGKTVLPAVRQAFYPAGGIVSGAGLKMFADTFNAGEDISDWTVEGSAGKVRILSDIDMTDIAWTAIGSEARPFAGTIEGNDHLILNWNASQPLFGYLAEGSEVSGLTIDASSKLTAKTLGADGFTAAIAGVSNGTLRNCRNMAAVTLDADAATEGAAGVAGVVGLVGASGRVEACSNNALITLGDKVVGYKLSIGGVVAETAEGAVVANCINEGAIASNGATPKDSKAGLYTGGVVGYAGGTVENCTTEGGKTIALRIRAAYMSYTGGVVGWADDDVTGCTNKQPVSITANRLSDACRYAYAGGVAGKAAKTLSGSKNRGNLSAAAICKFVIMGGIVGSADGAVSDVVNAAAISVPGNPEGVGGALAEEFRGPRYAYVGGIAGQLMRAGSITGNGDTTNTGAVSVEQMEYSTVDVVNAGGIVGQLAGKVSDTVNEGEVTVSAEPASGAFSWRARCLGGIAGMLGIIDTESEGASVAGSTNVALVKHLRLKSKNNGLPVYQGGIAGYILAAGCSVTECTNRGEVNSDSYNNHIDYWVESGSKRTNITGGIVGAAVSSGEANVISSCSNSGSLVVYRGIAAGVAGYVDGAKITGCTNTGDFPIANRNGRSGGIAGQALHTQVENCLNRATVTADGTGDATVVKFGGIVGALDDGSSIRGCKHYGTLYSQTYGTAKFAGGGILGTSVSGTTVDECGFGGQIKSPKEVVDLTLDKICSDSKFTGSGNYLWDGK